jgi:hypothetical protein
VLRATTEHNPKPSDLLPILTIYFPNTNLNIILLTLSSPQSCKSLLSNQNSVCITCNLQPNYMSSPPLPPRFQYPKRPTQSVQITKFFNMSHQLFHSPYVKNTYFGAGSPSASHSIMKGLSFSFCCCAT